MRTIKQAQVHRFTDMVALYVEGCSTVYLTVDQATRLGAALELCALDVGEVEDFFASKFRTFALHDGESN